MQTPEGAPIPPNTLAELERDLARLRFVAEQARAIEKTRLDQLKAAPKDRPNAMVLMLARVIGVGIETADMLVHEVLTRGLRDRRAVGRYAGITGSPDESGAKRREKGLAKAGNSRVRRGMLQLAWRWLMFQKDSDLTQWFRARTENAPPRARKTMIVALARKLLITLWRYTTNGEVPAGVVLRPQCDNLVGRRVALETERQRRRSSGASDHDPRWRCTEEVPGFRRSTEWSRRPGASPPMRMAASWSRACTAPPNTRLWREDPRPWHGSARISPKFVPPLAGGLGMLRVKARAYARPLRG